MRAATSAPPTRRCEAPHREPPAHHPAQPLLREGSLGAGSGGRHLRRGGSRADPPHAVRADPHRHPHRARALAGRRAATHAVERHPALGRHPGRRRAGHCSPRAMRRSTFGSGASTTSSGLPRAGLCTASSARAGRCSQRRSTGGWRAAPRRVWWPWATRSSAPRWVGIFKVSERARERRARGGARPLRRRRRGAPRRPLVPRRRSLGAADLTFTALSGPVLMYRYDLDELRTANPAFADLVVEMRATPAGRGCASSESVERHREERVARGR